MIWCWCLVWSAAAFPSMLAIAEWEKNNLFCLIMLQLQISSHFSIVSCDNAVQYALTRFRHKNTWLGLGKKMFFSS